MLEKNNEFYSVYQGSFKKWSSPQNISNGKKNTSNLKMYFKIIWLTYVNEFENEWNE